MRRRRFLSDQAPDPLRPLLFWVGGAVGIPVILLIWFMARAAQNESAVLEQQVVSAHREVLRGLTKSFQESVMGIPGQIENSTDWSRRAATWGIESTVDLVLETDNDGQARFPVPAAEESTPDPALADFLLALEALPDPARAEQAKALLETVRATAATAGLRWKARHHLLGLAEEDERDREAVGLRADIRAALESGSLDPRSSGDAVSVLLRHLAEGWAGEEEWLLTADVVEGRYPPGLPVGLRIAGARRLLENPSPGISADRIARLEAHYSVWERSERLASAGLSYLWERHHPPTRIAQDGEEVFLKWVRSGDRRIVLGRTWESLVADLEAHFPREPVEHARLRVTDGAGATLHGAEPPDHAMRVVSFLDFYVPGWKAEIWTARDSGMLSRTRWSAWMVYGTGVALVGFVLLVGVAAMRALSQQIRLNSLKNDFIGTVSHELKTPLASMRLLVDTLLEGRYRDSTQVREYLELICRENQRLTRLVDNFLTFSRMERRHYTFHPEAVDPAEVARYAAGALGARLQPPTCAFTLDCPENLPPVRADFDSLVTVLINLLDNACKYSSEPREVRLWIEVENDAVVFAVRDNGHGISKRDQKRIFERFFQADRRLARSAEGCGLGLSIVKFIVDGHRGTISVESEPGKGSTFRVVIPLARSADDDRNGPRQRDASSPEVSLSPAGRAAGS
ncbi:MAG: sensor histidine kinase [Puniceicoccaceae bacterium]|nr:MAG: sensor histidine kinase [Puniceicoccaceae bacterium]